MFEKRNWGLLLTTHFISSPLGNFTGKRNNESVHFEKWSEARPPPLSAHIFCPKFEHRQAAHSKLNAAAVGLGKANYQMLRFCTNGIPLPYRKPHKKLHKPITQVVNELWQKAFITTSLTQVYGFKKWFKNLWPVWWITMLTKNIK